MSTQLSMCVLLSSGSDAGLYSTSAEFGSLGRDVCVKEAE